MTGQDRPLYPLSVLVADDSPAATDTIAMVLALYGHTVRTARCGVDVLRQAVADPPDVVLLNVRMSGRNGYEVARHLRRRARGRPPLLVAMTGCGTEDDRLRSAEAGIDLHLVKPVDPTVLDGLLWRFAKALSELPARRAVRRQADVGSGPGASQSPGDPQGPLPHGGRLAEPVRQPPGA
jgi:two-component system, OmpR family, response regulator